MLGPMPPPSITDWLLGMLFVQCVFALIAIVGAAWSRTSIVDRLGLARGHLSHARCAALGIGVLSLSAGIDGLLGLAGLREESVLGDLDAALRGLENRDLALALLVVGVLPGISEELLFRGLLQRGLAARLGQAAAVVAASVAFAAMHGDLVHAAATLPLGLALGAAAARADSVRPAIFCHAANNLLAVYTSARWPELAAPGLLGTGLALALAAACLAVALRARKSVEPLQIGSESDDG